ncbi:MULTISPECIES: hypothetical protein [unclassified Pseudomonas]|uniref:hypothetical protein n=1 Tax=unclassified Pseudomonas TaxID=196821 RepID=UPI00128B7F30|nr:MULTISPECIES: hypothetical protein [unclassified Pseudomonas]MPQ70095.1 hypothetical protein [Pseudomonas sp. MWU12-2323]
MNGKIVSLGVLLLIAGGFDIQAVNGAGQIRFFGEIVESGCEVGTSAAGHPGADSRLLKVSSAVSLNVDTAANACRDGRVPFSASYQPLASSVTTRQVATQGVVTLTYN